MKQIKYLLNVGILLAASYSCTAIPIGTNLLHCVVDGDGFNNLCKIEPQSIYNSPLDDNASVEFDYKVYYSWPCHDNFKGGIAIENNYAGHIQTSSFDYNGSLAELIGSGDLNLIDTAPSGTAKAILPPECTLTISKVEVTFSNKQIGIFRGDVCQINRLAQIKSDLALLKTVSDSMSDSMKRGMNAQQKLKFLNAIKESLSKQLWLKQDSTIQQELLDIIGSANQSGSLLYIIQNIQNLDDYNFEINVNQVFTKLNNFFDNANLLIKNTAGNIFNYDSYIYKKLSGFSEVSELNSNLNWVNANFYDNDASGFTEPNYCK